MSLTAQSARLSKVDPWAWLEGVPTRLLAQLSSRIDELLARRGKTAT